MSIGDSKIGSVSSLRLMVKSLCPLSVNPWVLSWVKTIQMSVMAILLDGPEVQSPQIE